MEPVVTYNVLLNIWFDNFPVSSGYLTAQYNIGVNYFSGLGVEHDFSKAAYYFDIAARQGHVPAQVCRHFFLNKITTFGTFYIYVFTKHIWPIPNTSWFEFCNIVTDFTNSVNIPEVIFLPQLF